MNHIQCQKDLKIHEDIRIRCNYVRCTFIQRIPRMVLFYYCFQLIHRFYRFVLDRIYHIMLSTICPLAFNTLVI